MLIVFAGFGKPILLACARRGCQIWPSGQLSYAAAAKIRRPCSRQTSYARLPFTIALSNNAIDVFDMVLTKVTPSDFEAIS